MEAAAVAAVVAAAAAGRATATKISKELAVADKAAKEAAARAEAAIRAAEQPRNLRIAVAAAQAEANARAAKAMQRPLQPVGTPARTPNVKGARPTFRTAAGPSAGGTPTNQGPDVAAVDPPPRPYLRVRGAIKAWRALGASRWVIRSILDGPQISWKRRPKYHRARPFPVAPKDVAFAEAEMELCERLENWTELHGSDRERPVVIVNGFVTWSAGKQRIVIDARYQNKVVDDRRFRYEGLQDLAPQLRVGDQLLSCDVKDAYQHIPLRLTDRPYFTFLCQGRVFQCNAMPFGPMVAPYVWTKLCRPVVQALRREGYRVIAYVDDFGGGPPTTLTGGATKEAATAAGRRVKELCYSLGMHLHPLKGVWDGTTCLPLLGFLVDTEKQLLLLRPDRARKVSGTAGRLLAGAKTHRRWVRFSALRSFCGTAVSTQLAVTEARYRLRSLYTAMRDYRKETGGPVRLGRQAMTDLQ